MQRFGGIVPEVASREHLKGLPLALQDCLEKAGLKLDEIDWFSVTHRPGLIQHFSSASALSSRWPLPPENHFPWKITSKATPFPRFLALSLMPRHRPPLDSARGKRRAHRTFQSYFRR